MKLLTSLDKKILIYGTGLDAVRLFYTLKNLNMPVGGFINKNSKIKEFCGLKVYDCKRELIKGYYVIVASRFQSYMQIKMYLDTEELSEFDEYIFYEWLDKKIVFVHGNCHVSVIKEYLNSSSEFNKKYVIYPTKLIQEMESGIDQMLLVNCDVWIHQEIRNENPFGYRMSDEYIRKKINPNVREIIISNTFGEGHIYFPQADMNNIKNRPISNGEDRNGIFPDNDAVISRCLDSGMSIEDIINYCTRNDIFTEKQIINNFNTCLDKIYEREKNCDIKVYELIRNNYKDTKLFYDPGHPTNIVLEYIAVEILKLLGIVENRQLHAINNLSAHELPIYPQVQKVLGLKFRDDEIRKGNRDKKLTEKMNFEEYIKQYIWYCYSRF